MSNVTSTGGGTLSSASIDMGMLIGDTTADNNVNSGEVSQTKARSGGAVDGTTFRSDVTVDGNINSGDVSLVKSKSGNGLPP